MQKLQLIFGDRSTSADFSIRRSRSQGVTFLFAASHARLFGKYRLVVTLNRGGRKRNKKERRVRREKEPEWAEVKAKRRTEHVGCDHTSTKAPDPISTRKLSMLERE